MIRNIGTSAAVGAERLAWVPGGIAVAKQTIRHAGTGVSVPPQRSSGGATFVAMVQPKTGASPAASPSEDATELLGEGFAEPPVHETVDHRCGAREYETAALPPST